jgi:hypothetical protein
MSRLIARNALTLCLIACSTRFPRSAPRDHAYVRSHDSPAFRIPRRVIMLMSDRMIHPLSAFRAA